MTDQVLVPAIGLQRELGSFPSRVELMSWAISPGPGPKKIFFGRAGTDPGSETQSECIRTEPAEPFDRFHFFG